MNAFEFATSGRIIFEAGGISQLTALAAGFGRRPFLVTGKHARHAVVACDTFSVPSEPTIALVREGAERFRHSVCDLVIAIGGGSAIDAGKAIAAAAANPGDLPDYLEIIGRGQPLEQAPWPVIAVPTTAGTGAEVTRNAVLGSPEHGVKVSLRSPLMLPRIALVDPALTLDLPPDITAWTGLDALTQLIEPYVSRRANPLTDALCLDGIRYVAGNLKRACEDGHDLTARSAMSYASLLGGMALTNAGLGVVHGFAAPIGGMFPIPHGAVCAALLAPGMAANIRAARQREPQETDTLARYAGIAAVLTGRPDATPEDGVEWVRNLVRALPVPSLKQWGIEPEHAAELAEKASGTSSMKANPVTLTRAELEEMIIGALREQGAC